MNQRIAKLSRVVVVMLTVVAWFSISNHCALGGLITPKAQFATAPMHCHGNQPLPSKNSGNEEVPCCKLLRATLSVDAKIFRVATKNFLPIQTWIAAELPSVNETQIGCESDELDTGPPFAVSFAESVLQRSVLAHAPPLSLS